MRQMLVRESMLLDRDDELARIERSLEAGASERGLAVAILGAPGIGKSSLLAASARLAESRGFVVARARGDEVERQLGFGVVHQLLIDPVLREHARAAVSDGTARAAAALVGSSVHGPGPDELSVLHSLWSIVAEAAAERPLALVVDDVQWADEPSLRFFSFLAKRMSGLSAMLLVSSRPLAGDAALASLITAAEVVEPAALTGGSVRAVIAETLDEEPEPEFVTACAEISGGNPFYLGQLLLAARVRGLRPLADRTRELAELGPHAIGESVLARCRNAGADALALAQAIAVLGPEVELRHAAGVATLEPEPAARAWDALVEAHVLRASAPPAFLHPVLRAAVLSEIPHAERARLHARAADELAAAGAEAGRVALHLLAIEPRATGGDVAVLRAAADTEVARGAPASAIRILRRALAERLTDAQRAALELDLARHEAATGDKAGESRLRRLATSSQLTPAERARAAAMLMAYLIEYGAISDVRDVHSLLLDPAQQLEPDLRLMHEAISLGAVRYGYLRATPDDRSYATRVASAGVDGSTPGRRAASLLRGLLLPSDGDAAIAAGYFEQALADGALLHDEPWGPMASYAAANQLVGIGRLDLAGPVAQQLRELGRETGSTYARYRGAELEVNIAFYRGDLAAAEALAAPVADNLDDRQINQVFSCFSVLAAIERGELDEADRRLARAREVPGLFVSIYVPRARAWLRLAQHRYEEAIAAANAADPQTHVAWGPAIGHLDHPRWVRALAGHALGDTTVARAEAAEAVARARRTGDLRRLGISLRVAAAVSDRAEAPRLLEEAIACLDRAGARLELAKSLVDLGVVLRSGGHRVDAREPLRRGLDLATRCGATALVERAREELRLAGAKPRRDVVTGRDSLTRAENRVAQLAAQGMTNRAIAQSLFLSVRTVETHLLRIYGKLDINSRAELGRALAELV